MSCHRRSIAVFAFTLCLAGCRSEVPEVPVASLEESPNATSTEPSYTPSSEPPPETTLTDIKEVPEAVTATYVEEVLEALYTIDVDALRVSAQAGHVTPDAIERVRAVYDRGAADEQVQILERGAEARFPNLRNPVGQVEVEIADVLSASPECIFAAGLRDFSEVDELAPPRGGERDYFQLLRKEPGQDGNAYNVTPWVIGGTVVATDASTPENPCL